jgi:hypothetical protein
LKFGIGLLHKEAISYRHDPKQCRWLHRYEARGLQSTIRIYTYYRYGRTLSLQGCGHHCSATWDAHNDWRQITRKRLYERCWVRVHRGCSAKRAPGLCVSVRSVHRALQTCEDHLRVTTRLGTSWDVLKPTAVVDECLFIKSLRASAALCSPSSACTSITHSFCTSVND